MDARSRALLGLEYRIPRKSAFYIVTEAGIVGKYGFNNRGLGVYLNDDAVVAPGIPAAASLKGDEEVHDGCYQRDQAGSIQLGELLSAADLGCLSVRDV